jgi:hypothetical protein
MGRNPSQGRSTPAVFFEQHSVELNFVPFCRPRLATMNHFGGSEIRATKTGERVTVGPGHGVLGLLFRPGLLLWNLANEAWLNSSAAEISPRCPTPTVLPRLSS